MVENKREEKAKSVTSTQQPADLKEENQEAEKTMASSANYRSTGAELDATNTSSNTSSKAPASDTSKPRSAPPIPFGSVSRPESDLTPRTGADASKSDSKSTKKSLDNSQEKSPKNLNPAVDGTEAFSFKPAVDGAKADVKKKPAASNQ